jgi:putative ABC transport system permease protein
MAVEHFKFSFNSVLEQRSRTLLGADLGIRSRQGMPKEELNKILERLPEGIKSYRQLSLFSMVQSAEQSRLISLRGIERKWPFYGGLELSKQGIFPRKVQKRAHFLKSGEVWAYEELRLQLGVEVGERIKIGGKDFRVADFVIEDSQQTFDQGGLAPRVFMRLDDLEKLDLVGSGSRYSERWYFKWPVPINSRELTSKVQKLEELLDDPAVEMLSPQKSSNNVGRTLNYLNDFLSLVSLVSLFLACVGLFYLYRSYLNNRRVEMATLCCLGLSRKKIFQLYLFHLTALSLLGTFFAFGISLVLFPLVSQLLSVFLPFDLPSYSGLRPFLIGGSVGLLGQWLLAYPLLKPIFSVRPQQIFQSLEDDSEKSGLLSMILSFLPWCLFYWALAIYASNSLIIGSAFVGIFIGVSVFAFPLGSFILSFLEKLELPGPLHFRLAIKTLTRFRFSSLSLFISLVLGSLLLNIIPQIEKNLQEEIQAPANEQRLPGLFVFDIQEEQVEPLKTMMKENDLKLQGISPLVRARIMRINGEEFKRADSESLTREEERTKRMRNRGINLTFRKELAESESLLRGRHFTQTYDSESDELPEISVEYRYAGRIGLEIGDTVEFDILDMPIKARIVGIRQIKWTSFMPNFFIVFQPGVIDDAPKTYLAVSPALETERKVWLQNEITKRFPNISMIDVESVITKLMSLLKQMSWALQVMALLSIFVGLFVLYSLVQHQMNQRKKDMTLLKVLGMRPNQLKKTILIEFLAISLCASLFGGLISLGVTFVFSYFFFDGIWTFDLLTPFLIALLLTGVCLAVSFVAARSTIKVRAQKLLQEFV